MSFCRNTSQQLSFFDSTSNLTKRELKGLENSWAQTFSTDIFPIIDENRFSVLYSDNPASRPNNPVNVTFGLTMIREMLDLSDDESKNSLMFDIRFQYALHTTSFKEQPISKNSLTNFRAAVQRYYEKTGIDIIKEEIERIAKIFAKQLDINGDKIRMDSLMISSSCKRLSRLEIMYSCVERLVKKLDEDKLSDSLKMYLDKKNYTDVIYRCRNTDINTRLAAVITDAVALVEMNKDTDVVSSQDYINLTRMLDDQTKIVDGKYEIKPSKEISAVSLQNPTDTDATYRKKGKTGHVGYVGNVAETFDGNNSIITHYDLQQNIYHDKDFANDFINKMDIQEEKTTVIVDGAFYSEEIAAKASEKNLEFIPTNLVGRETTIAITEYQKFLLDEKNHTIVKCPMGKSPISCRYQDGMYTAYFHKDTCSLCINRHNCPIKEQKKRFILTVSEKVFHRAALIEKMGSKEYKELAALRAGVEGIPSTMRRRYGIDDKPVRGKSRMTLWFGILVGAMNCKSYIKGKMNAPLKHLGDNMLEVLCFQRASFMIAA